MPKAPNSSTLNKSKIFLPDGGEAGMLVRSFDWETTSLGLITEWPQNFLVCLRILLSSKFPMFIFWGKENICIYNDAYIPSFGNSGRHPWAFGRSAAEVFSEKWTDIEKLIDRVYSGESIYVEDDHLISFRNDSPEDVYWTYGYTPILDDQGKIDGVFITSHETTRRIKELKSLEENNEKLEFAIEASEMATWDLNLINNKFTANKRYTEWFGIAQDGETDNDLALSVIAEEDRERVIAEYTEALENASDKVFDCIYTIRPENKPERILRAKGKAWLGHDNKATQFTGTLQDITEEIRAQNKIQESEARLRSFIEGAPIAMSLFTGPDMKIEFANSIMLGYWGKDASIIGMPLAEALPELVGQPYLKILDDIYADGHTFEQNAAPVDFVVGGKLQTFYFDYTYKPFFNPDGKVYGIMDQAIDVSEKILAQKALEESRNELCR